MFAKYADAGWVSVLNGDLEQMPPGLTDMMERWGLGCVLSFLACAFSLFVIAAFEETVCEPLLCLANIFSRPPLVRCIQLFHIISLISAVPLIGVLVFITGAKLEL